ncbi:MAG: hypothetical protein BZ133_06575 [Methanosphaera sp. SHI613]|nr:MAG: hypothetical protein BZ133_06575 [Methanosphaera sp. SHI613]
MNIKIKNVLFFLAILTLVMGLSCVSAADEGAHDSLNDTVKNTCENKVIETTNIENNEVTKTDKTIEKNNLENEKSIKADSKIDTTAKVERFSAKIGDNIQLKAIIKDENGNNVDGGKVLFKVNKETIKVNNQISYAQVIDSEAILNYTIPKSWNKTINLEAVYAGTSKYNSCRSDVLTLNGMKLDTTVTVTSYNLVYGENIRLASKVIDERGNLVSGGKVIYKINGATLKSNNTAIEIRVRNGSAILNYTTPLSWATTNITIQAVYSGNEIFEGSRSTSSRITVKESIINSNNLIKTTNDIVYLSVNVTDEDAKIIPTGKIRLYQNNKLIGENSLINGKRELYLGKMSAGNHDFKLEFVSSGYSKTTIPVSVTIKKETPIVNLLLDIPQATQKGGKLELRAYVTFNSSRYYKTNINKGYVLFKIDNKEIKKVGVVNSKALYNYTMPNDNSNHIIDAYYVSGVYGNNTDTQIIQTMDKSGLNSGNTAIKGNKNPLNTRIETVNGMPNVSLMTNYVWADENATYTLTRQQYQEVTVRDSYSLYLNNYMSKYVAFKTKDEPNVYHVIRREKWNVIEKAINLNLVLSNGGSYPEEITAKLKGVEYTYSEVRDIQNTSYTCGPTSVSMCSQTLKTYTSEYRLSVNAGSTYSDGSTTSGLANAARMHNMSATIYYNTTFDKALNELAKGGCALVFHTWNHYVAILDISRDKTKVLVGNPSGSYNEGSHGLPTNWLSVSYVKSCFNNYDTSGLILKLDYDLDSTTKNQVNNMYNNFGVKFIKSDTSERIPNT